MPFTFEQTVELEEVKQRHKEQVFAFQEKLMDKEHRLKIERLEKQLEIAKAESKAGT